jgi:hypothetical protein
MKRTPADAAAINWIRMNLSLSATGMGEPAVKLQLQAGQVD